MLQAFKKRANLRIGPVRVADDLAADDALAVDDVGFRPAFSAEELGGGLAGIADRGEVDVAADQEAAVGVGIFVDADAKDGQVGPVVVEIDQSRHLLNAWRAPCGPEVEHDDLAPVVGQMDGSGSVGDGEVGGWLVHQVGMRAAVATGREGQQQEKSQRE